MYNACKTIGSNLDGKDFYETILLKENTFLFITRNNPLLEKYQLYFPESEVDDSFFEAKIKLSGSIRPGLIIVDIPLNPPELKLFRHWLRDNQLHNIPLLYNESALEKNTIAQLFVQKLVDDVVHLEKDYKKLPKKAAFLKKVLLQNNLTAANHTDRYLFKQERSCMILFDTIIASLFIICLLPLFILITVAIFLDSKGPVFYTSPRAGMGFKIFSFYKFRTMVVDADKKRDELEELNIYSSENNKANFFKIKNDPRITKVGAFLRNTSLDELPQLFNVLKGDMSLVGNRPLPIYEASTLTTNDWAERFMAPAGITGLWQISKRGNPEMSTEERILLDITYARNRSLMGDLKILIKTPAALKQKINV